MPNNRSRPSLHSYVKRNIFWRDFFERLHFIHTVDRFRNPTNYLRYPPKETLPFPLPATSDDGLLSYLGFCTMFWWETSISINSTPPYWLCYWYTSQIIKTFVSRGACDPKLQYPFGKLGGSIFFAFVISMIHSLGSDHFGITTSGLPICGRFATAIRDNVPSHQSANPCFGEIPSQKLTFCSENPFLLGRPIFRGHVSSWGYQFLLWLNDDFAPVPLVPPTTMQQQMGDLNLWWFCWCKKSCTTQDASDPVVKYLYTI